MTRLSQTDRQELLDRGLARPHEVKRSLGDIQRINTCLGGARIAADATFAMLRRHRLTRATLLDAGTGSADIPRRLAREAQRTGVGLRIIALDSKLAHLRLAQQEGLSHEGVCLVQGDAFRLPLPDRGVDVVLASLFLHHFRPPQILLLLREFDRVSRVGWIVNDLVRAAVPLAVFRLAAPVFARSYITRHDGAASIKRAYTVPEMQQILVAGQLSEARVQSHFPYRLSIVRDKAGAVKGKAGNGRPAF